MVWPILMAPGLGRAGNKVKSSTGAPSRELPLEGCESGKGSSMIAFVRTSSITFYPQKERG
jgi:hypothetical protein